jgi:hypothetical protein
MSEIIIEKKPTSFMWKNVFLESCLLSALIFGGFYLNATLLQNDLYSENNTSSHISGFANPLKPQKHISGKKSEEESHLSGSVSPAQTGQ